MRMVQVDAFASRVFEGNPAAVLILDDWLGDETMLAIAQENNLAETAFAKPRSDGSWDLRWFAPEHEVDFCGHATLATAHVLMSDDPGRADILFHTRVGPLRVARSDDGYCLDIPCLLPEPVDTLPGSIAGVFAAPPEAVFRNFENLFCELSSAEAVRHFVPDFSAIATLGRAGLVITAVAGPGSRADFVCRYFAPGAGIPEDPVTGSIHATLVPYWSAKFGRRTLLSHQASKRGGWIHCEWSKDRVLLRGRATTFMEATINLPVQRPA